MGAKEFNHDVQEFFEYCRKGNAEKVNIWIQNRAKKLKSPLKFLRPTTIGLGWLSCLREPSTSYTALHQASLYGHYEVVIALVEQDHKLVNASDRRGCLPLHLAAWNGHAEVVEYLLSVEPSAVDAPNNAKECPLHLAAMHGHARIVEFLLQKHADARLRNARFETALDIAARTGKDVICKIFLVNCPELALQSAAESTTTSLANRTLLSKVVYPLHLAARYGNRDCISVLCESGFNVNYVTDEGTALHVAATFGQAECVTLLIEHGADLNIRDCDGRTVLERLNEMEKQRNSHVTHIARSVTGWAECRQLIENALNSPDLAKEFKQLPDQITFHPSNVLIPSPRLPPHIENPVVWRVPPPEKCSTSSEAAEELSHSSFHSSHSNSSKSANGRCSLRNPPPLLADGCSPVSLNGGLNGASRIFPRTSANGHHNFRHFTGQAARFSNNMGRTPPISTNPHAHMSPCNYQSPPNQPVYGNVCQHNNCQHTVNAWTSNTVPMTYDNAPPSNCTNRKWTHNCCANIANENSADFTKQMPITIGISGGKHHIFSHSQIEKADGTFTMPPVRANPRPSVLQTFAQTDNFHKSVENFDGKTLKDAQNIGNSNSASTSGFSTLEKVDVYDDIDTSAPIAVPEEMESSTYASNFSVSPERRFPTDSLPSLKNRSSNDSRSPILSKKNVNNGTSLSPISSTLSTLADNNTQRETSDDRRFPTSSLENVDNNEERARQSSKFSSVSDDRRNGNDDISSASSSKNSLNNLICSPPIQMASYEVHSTTNSTSSNSEKSFQPPTAHERKDFRNLIVNGKIVDSDAKLKNQNLSFGVAAEKNTTEENSPIMRNSNSSTDSQAIMRRNHSAEWKKIDEILSSIQRESFFGVQNQRSTKFEEGNSNDAIDRKSTNSLEFSADKIGNSLDYWLHFTVGYSRADSSKLASILETNGFENIHFLKGCLNNIVMTEMGIENSLQAKLLSFMDTRIKEMIPSVEEFEYLSDWLDALELIDYLGSFAKANLTYTPDIIAARLTRSDLEKMGVHFLGHISRIMHSLEFANRNASRPKQNSDSKTDFLRFLGSVEPPPLETLNDVGANTASCSENASVNSGSNSNSGRTTGRFNCYDCSAPESFVSTDFSMDSTKRRQILLDECVSFSAHYLGSVEISNVEGAEDCRRAMSTSKKRIKQVNKVPQVILEISVGGVNVLDASTNQLTVQHEINRIQVVCQDELDLNCFAYIFQDGEKNFCHVYCVLTAGVAKDIIITLGEAFNLAYSLLNENNANNFHNN